MTAGDDDDDDGSAGGKELVEQVRLHAWQSEVLGIAALAGRPVTEQTGEVADEGQTQVGFLCHSAGSGET